MLSGKKVLITAGPTQEALDPVRYISNHSTGKMGYCLATGFLNRGATVFLVSGPVHLQLDHPCLQVIRVVSAREMLDACRDLFDWVDIAVFAAADIVNAVASDLAHRENTGMSDPRLIEYENMYR